MGNRTEFTYDALNRQTQVKDALTGETVTKYDKAGNVLEVTDPEQNTTSFTYDNRNRLTSETNELGDSRSFDYDSLGNLIRTSDRNNRVTEWTYDALNRPQEENWLDSIGNPVNTISLDYDAVGQLVAIDDSHSSYRFTYDEKGRQTSADNTGTPGAPNVLLEYSYDNRDNLISVSETINGKAAGITAYSYDELNRTSQIVQTGTGVANKRVDFSYDAISQFASIERYSDLSGSQLVGSSTYTYDGLNRLTNLNHSNGSGTFAFYDFEYDAASRITKIVDIDGTSDYTYDQTNQLTSASHTDPNKPNESYTYDDNGNRTNPGYQTGQNNQLQSDGTYNYSYDAEGNMVLQIEIATGEEREFVWDHRNRLTAIIDKDNASDALQEVGFTYDAMNRRIAKEVNADPQNSSSGVVMHFVSDRDNVLLEFVDADGIDGIEEPTFHQRYLHGPAVDQMLAQENASGESIWNFTDHLGTGRDLTDNDGNVVNHLIYDSFGNVVSQTNNAFKSRYLFTGREFDEKTGLYYYRARYYDGFIGRFISPDPIGFDGGDANLYRYVGNDPISWSDPSGNCRIYLRYRGYHADVFVTDKNGTRVYWAEADNKDIQYYPSGAIRNSSGSSPSEGFGNINYRQTDSNARKNFTSADPESIQNVHQTSSCEDGNLAPCPDIEKKIADYFQSIEDQKIPYGFLRANSNATAFQALHNALGYRPIPEPGRWVPGWDFNPETSFPHDFEPFPQQQDTPEVFPPPETHDPYEPSPGFRLNL